MTPDEFQQHLENDPYLSQVVGQAARAGQRSRTFGVLTEAAVVTLMFPIVQYVLCEIGLPWLFELRRFSELQRQRVHRWIDSQYQKHGFDPDEAEAASDALLDELEQTTDERARASWQQLATLIKSEGGDQ
jgi:hypothetical protein